MSDCQSVPFAKALAHEIAQYIQPDTSYKPIVHCNTCGKIACQRDHQWVNSTRNNLANLLAEEEQRRLSVLSAWQEKNPNQNIWLCETWSNGRTLEIFIDKELADAFSSQESDDDDYYVTGPVPLSSVSVSQLADHLSLRFKDQTHFNTPTWISTPGQAPQMIN